MLPRYLSDVAAINRGLSSFNRFLSPAHQVPTLNFETMVAQQHCVRIVHGDWNAFRFPNSTKRGVYFILGYEQGTPDKNGLYIGKASCDSAIGVRLYRWLTGCRNRTHFVKKGNRGEIYILEYMVSVDLDSVGIPFIAPSLEEFLIAEIKDEVNLLNGVGTRPARPSPVVPAAMVMSR